MSVLLFIISNLHYKLQLETLQYLFYKTSEDVLMSFYEKKLLSIKS